MIIWSLFMVFAAFVLTVYGIKHSWKYRLYIDVVGMCFMLLIEVCAVKMILF